MAIINKARAWSHDLVVLSDRQSPFKRYPLIPFAERKALFENMAGVERVVEQKTLSYKENLLALKPDYSFMVMTGVKVSRSPSAKKCVKYLQLMVVSW